MNYQDILNAGGLNEQQGQIDQQIADLIARRRAYQPHQATTGLGALLGGIGDIRAANRFRDQEDALRQERQGLSTKLAGTRSAYLDAVMGAQQPVTAPPGVSPGQQFSTPVTSAPNTSLAPLQDKAGAEQDQQQQQRRLQILGMLSGDPMMGSYVKQAPQLALEQEKVKGAQLEQAMGRQKMEQAGPQAGLGGNTPNVFELLTKREQVPKYGSDMFGRYNQRTGASVSTPGSGMGDLLSPEAIDQSAALYLKTGQLPAMGRANPVLHGAILKRAAELSGGADVATGRAAYGADKGSLAKAQAQADAIDSFENTALKNLDQFLATAHGVIDTGSPLLNAPIRSLSNKVMGDTNMTKFNTARQVAIQEISKVLGGAVSGGAVTEGQRHEVEGLIRGDASVAQIEAAANILKTDMANRKASVAQQLQTIRGRISGKPAATETTTQAAAGGAGQATHRFNAATGKIEAIP